MNRLCRLAVSCAFATFALGTAAKAQQQPSPPPYIYTPPPEQPPVHYQRNTNSSGTRNGYVAPAPFGALFNVLSGNMVPPSNGQPPTTAFNTQRPAPLP